VSFQGDVHILWNVDRLIAEDGLHHLMPSGPYGDCCSGTQSRHHSECQTCSAGFPRADGFRFPERTECRIIPPLSLIQRCNTLKGHHSLGIPHVLSPSQPVTKPRNDPSTRIDCGRNGEDPLTQNRRE
jgi:hypothetical protein